jgi:hypothetical protein
MKGWTPQAIEQAAKSQNQPTTRPKASQATPVPVEAGGAGRGQESPAFVASPAGPRTFLVGPYALAVGGRLHAEQLPDRLRIVVTGPASPELTAALVAALTQFTNQP